jgi:hypothetical protein
MLFILVRLVVKAYPHRSKNGDLPEARNILIEKYTQSDVGEDL